MEAQAAFIWADSAVELHPVAVAGVGVPLVVRPGHQEGDHPLRLHHAGEQVQLLIAGIVQSGVNHLQPGLHRLQVLPLAGVLLTEPL